MASSSLNQLALFAAVARAGGIAAGARTLGMSAAAAEERLRALEERLGHELLRVERGRLALTPAGERTLEAVGMLGTAVPAAGGDVDRTVAAPRPAPAERVTLGAHPLIFAHLRERLAAFEDAHADIAIDLDLDCFTAAAAQRKIAAAMVDIAYFYTLPGGVGGDAAAGHAPASTYAWSERVSLFVGDAHPLAAKDLVDRDDLALVPPLHLAPDNPLRPLIAGLMDIAGFGAAPPACESDDHALLLDRVRAGAGVIALFGPLAQQFGGMDGVRRLPFAAMLPTLDVRRAIAPGDAPATIALAASLDDDG